MRLVSRLAPGERGSHTTLMTQALCVCGRGITYTEASLVRVVFVTVPTHMTIHGFEQLWPVDMNNLRLPDN